MKWISVKDSQPERGQRFLAYTKFRDRIEVLQMRTWGEQGWAVGGLQLGKDITHWMPLPEPPEVQSHD